MMTSAVLTVTSVCTTVPKTYDQVRVPVMPPVRDLRNRVVTPENVALTTAVVLSIVGTYAVQHRVSDDVAAFFGLIVLGVSTPTTLTSHDLLGSRPSTAIVRAGVACTATFVTYVGLLMISSGRGEGALIAGVAFALTALAVEGVARILD